jgi:hypothetical protein
LISGRFVIDTWLISGSWSSDEEWTTIAAMVRDTQDNGSNAVEGDTKDDSSVTNRQQAGSNDTQGTNATPTVDEQDTNDSCNCRPFLV